MPITENRLTEYVRQAVQISRDHVARGGIPFSGIVVKDDLVLGTGFNRVREDNDPSAHAEVVALREASTTHGLYGVAGATLVASGEPCALCYLTARYFNIDHVVFAVDRHTSARYGFDYLGSYSIFAEDPVKWPFEVTALPVEGATEPFEEFLTTGRTSR